jgi:hypothetical protein
MLWCCGCLDPGGYCLSHDRSFPAATLRGVFLMRIGPFERGASTREGESDGTPARLKSDALSPPEEDDSERHWC